MPVDSAQITVTTAATLLTSAVDSRDKGGIAITNRGSAAVYVGGPGVTTSTGYKLDAGESVAIDTDSPGDVAYGVVATGTETVHVLRAGR